MERTETDTTVIASTQRLVITGTGGVQMITSGSVLRIPRYSFSRGVPGKQFRDAHCSSNSSIHQYRSEDRRALVQPAKICSIAARSTGLRRISNKGALKRTEK